MEDRTREFQKTLKLLETSLETPLVPGELENWAATVREHGESTDRALRRQIAEVHAADYAEIVEQDPEMFRRVEQLQAGDQVSMEQLKSLLDRASQLAGRASRREPDEAALAAEQQQVADQGLAFVIHARKQEVARQTWLLEAFNRDRGVGD